MKVLSDWDAREGKANNYSILGYEKFEKFVRGSGSKSHFSSGALPVPVRYRSRYRSR